MIPMTSPSASKRQSTSERLLTLMSDGRWHHMRDLNRVTFRYGARFHEWKQDGRIVEKRRIGTDEFEYRLLLDGQGVLL